MATPKIDKKKLEKKKTSTAAAATPPIPIQLVPIDLIDPADINRPANVDIDELAESIRQKGVQQPIRLRPKDGGRFEIVYGERRWRASKKARLTTIPAQVEKLSDVDAHEARIMENSQRADLHPLEEAEAFERLLAMHDEKDLPVHTPETIAALAGRSVGHVYNRLKLTVLVPEVRRAFYAGTLNAAGAFHIARGVPPALQPEALTELLDDGAHLEPGDCIPATDVEDFIDRNFLTRLSQAPFPTKDKKLLPTVGSCDQCPKRSGNQAVLFQKDDPTDICTDRLCFKEKTRAIFARLDAEVRANGGHVLTEPESRKIFQGGSHLPYNSPWVALNATCYEDEKKRTFQKLLGDHAPPVTLAVTSQGQPVCLLDRKATIDALAKLGHAFAKKPSNPTTKTRAAPPATPAHANGDPGPATDEELGDDLVELPPDHPDSQERRRVSDPNEARRITLLENEALRRVAAAVIAKLEKSTLDDPALLRAMNTAFLHGGFFDAIQHIAKRRQLKTPKGDHVAETIKAHMLGLDAGGLRGLLFEFLIGRGGLRLTHWDGSPGLLKVVADLYGIDAAAIQKAVADEDEQKRSSKPPAQRTKSAA